MLGIQDGVPLWMDYYNNRAWALVRRKRHGDKEAAILSAKQARSFALIMEKTDAITLYSSFILNNFPNETY